MVPATVFGPLLDDSGLEISSPRTVAYLHKPTATLLEVSALDSERGIGGGSNLTSGMTANISVMTEPKDVSSAVPMESKGIPVASQSDTLKNFDEKVNVDAGQTKLSSPSTHAVIKGCDISPAESPTKEQIEPHVVPGYRLLMPQQGSGAAYYLPYHPQPQLIPMEPPSPSNPGIGTVAYDAVSFFQQPGTTPLSPPRPTATMGVIPPASPLFPRLTTSAGGSRFSSISGGIGGAPPSPNLSFVSSALGGVAYPHSYPPIVGPQSSDSPDEAAWSDRYANNATSLQRSSPQIMSYGVPIQTRAVSGGRAYSFDDSMLPPSALEQLDSQGNPAYSPYGGSQASPIQTAGNATLFAHQNWYGVAGTAAGLSDMYGSPSSPLQPRPQMGMYPGAMSAAGAMSGGVAAGGVSVMRGGSPSVIGPGHPYGFYPSSSPGPPIQTTVSNKGPDGANLFIFHVPNHFTNIDMYQLFCPYGTLLSVRIMVEKDTGRSRGFGFVSYDNPESAALAIKELNGFTVGNKRLKVQHKQIKSGRDTESFDAADGTSFFDTRPPSVSRPPSGPLTSQNLWYKAQGAEVNEGDSTEAPTDTMDSSGRVTNIADVSTLASTSPTAELGTTIDNMSPLASLGSLQATLPDVSGVVGVEKICPLHTEQSS